MIELGGPDEKDWRIGETALERRVRELSDEGLRDLLAELQKIMSKTLRARRVVQAEIERRGRGLHPLP